MGLRGGLPRGRGGPDPAQRSGKSERLRAWLSPWEKWRCPAERYIPIGDQVLVLTRYVGTAKGSGLPVDQEGAHLWTMRAGKAVRLEIYPDRRSALRTVGQE